MVIVVLSVVVTLFVAFVWWLNTRDAVSLRNMGVDIQEHENARG